MRTTKAFIASLGSTGSLIAGAAVILAVVSAVVAFRGWPGGGIANRIDSLVVPHSAQPPWALPGTQQVALASRAAAAAVQSAPRGPVIGAARSLGTELSGLRNLIDPVTGQPVPESNGPDDGVGGGFAPGDIIRDTTTDITGGVQNTGGNLAGRVVALSDNLAVILGRVHPDMATLVTASGQTLADALYETGRGASDALTQTSSSLADVLCEVPTGGNC